MIMSHTSEDEFIEQYKAFQDQVKEMQILINNMSGEKDNYFIKHCLSELKKRIEFIETEKLI